MRDVHWLHESEWGMSKRQLPPASNRTISQHDSGIQAIKLYRCVLRGQSDPDVRTRWGTHLLHHISSALLLQSDVIRPQECRRNLLATCKHDVQGYDRKDYGCICRWHVTQVENDGRPRRTSETDVQCFTEVLDEAQPSKVCLRGQVRQVPGLHG